MCKDRTTDLKAKQNKTKNQSPRIDLILKTDNYGSFIHYIFTITVTIY